ncbi:hypothetical protein PUW53_02465 [Lactobacillus crispatus]|uniref:hypothetical protein n=1 Tax=Lactobacillus crispatus TaxID=47770 RepID=UPI0001EC2A9A|nr:hypothetical protein [Lactobacillus crispatus]EFQ44204.1 hypothetical protein LBKG_01220 [Lactobacillus crispatus CTV-05]QGS05620.1 hypothetical protein FOC51_06005 [Lactobacillus crispatus]WEB22648.1 hypothetical protein PUW53_02465 [Lactobacillus crispatus]
MSKQPKRMYAYLLVAYYSHYYYFKFKISFKLRLIIKPKIIVIFVDGRLFPS